MKQFKFDQNSRQNNILKGIKNMTDNHTLPWLKNIYQAWYSTYDIILSINNKYSPHSVIISTQNSFSSANFYSFPLRSDLLFSAKRNKENTRKKDYKGKMEERSPKLRRFEDRVPPLVIIHWAESWLAIPSSLVRAKRRRNGKGRSY